MMFVIAAFIDATFMSQAILEPSLFLCFLALLLLSKTLHIDYIFFLWKLRGKKVINLLKKSNKSLIELRVYLHVSKTISLTALNSKPQMHKSKKNKEEPKCLDKRPN